MSASVIRCVWRSMLFATALLAAVSYGSAGCGTTKRPGWGTGGAAGANTTGGKSGAGGTSGTGGTAGTNTAGASGNGGTWASGGSSGGSGTDGVGGAAGRGDASGGAGGRGNGNTGGSSGTGGAIGTGGSAGGSSGVGGSGGCPDGFVCTLGARACINRSPVLCVADASGCPSWRVDSGCTCQGVIQVCGCNSRSCGTPPTAGTFCATQGATTYVQCAHDERGCVVITGTDLPCPGSTTCTATAFVPSTTGQACN